MGGPGARRSAVMFHSYVQDKKPTQRAASSGGVSRNPKKVVNVCTRKKRRGGANVAPCQAEARLAMRRLWGSGATQRLRHLNPLDHRCTPPCFFDCDPFVRLPGCTEGWLGKRAGIYSIPRTRVPGSPRAEAATAFPRRLGNKRERSDRGRLRSLAFGAR